MYLGAWLLRDLYTYKSSLKIIRFNMIICFSFNTHILNYLYPTITFNVQKMPFETQCFKNLPTLPLLRFAPPPPFKNPDYASGYEAFMYSTGIILFYASSFIIWCGSMVVQAGLIHTDNKVHGHPNQSLKISIKYKWKVEEKKKPSPL